MRVWELLFKASNRTNYSTEALTRLAQYHLIFIPCLMEQIRQHGLPGHNVSCYLHIENLKGTLKDLGANKMKKLLIQWEGNWHH